MRSEIWDPKTAEAKVVGIKESKKLALVEVPARRGYTGPPRVKSKSIVPTAMM